MSHKLEKLGSEFKDDKFRLAKDNLSGFLLK